MTTHSRQANNINDDEGKSPQPPSSVSPQGGLGEAGDVGSGGGLATAADAAAMMAGSTSAGDAPEGAGTGAEAGGLLVEAATEASLTGAAAAGSDNRAGKDTGAAGVVSSSGLMVARSTNAAAVTSTGATGQTSNTMQEAIAQLRFDVALLKEKSTAHMEESIKMQAIIEEMKMQQHATSMSVANLDLPPGKMMSVKRSLLLVRVTDSLLYTADKWNTAWRNYCDADEAGLPFWAQVSLQFSAKAGAFFNASQCEEHYGLAISLPVLMLAYHEQQQKHSPASNKQFRADWGRVIATATGGTVPTLGNDKDSVKKWVKSSIKNLANVLSSPGVQQSTIEAKMGFTFRNMESVRRLARDLDIIPGTVENNPISGASTTASSTSSGNEQPSNLAPAATVPLPAATVPPLPAAAGAMQSAVPVASANGDDATSTSSGKSTSLEQRTASTADMTDSASSLETGNSVSSASSASADAHVPPQPAAMPPNELVGHDIVIEVQRIDALLAGAKKKVLGVRPKMKVFKAKSCPLTQNRKERVPYDAILANYVKPALYELVKIREEKDVDALLDLLTRLQGLHLFFVDGRLRNDPSLMKAVIVE